MAIFDSGVSSYIKGRCVIEVNFPIDLKGNADVSCEQCPYYGRTSKTCQLNKQVVNFPSKYIGANCPLDFTGEIEGGKDE